MADGFTSVLAFLLVQNLLNGLEIHSDDVLLVPIVVGSCFDVLSCFH